MCMYVRVLVWSMCSMCVCKQVSYYRDLAIEGFCTHFSHGHEHKDVLFLCLDHGRSLFPHALHYVEWIQGLRDVLDQQCVCVCRIDR